MKARVLAIAALAVGCSRAPAPAAIAALDEPRALVGDARAAFAVDRAGLVSIAPNGAATRISGGEGALRLALDERSVYYATRDGAIRRATRFLGGDAALATEQPNVAGFAVDDVFVYWTRREDGAIRRVPKAGGAVASFVEGEADPRAIATGGGDVVWATMNGSIRRRARTGGPIATVATDPGVVKAIALDDSRVYWLAYGGGRARVVAAPREGGAPIVLASMSGMLPADLALDEGSVYWSACDGDDVTVMRASKQGGPATVMSRVARSRAAGIAVLGNRVLFAVDGTSGDVYSIARPR